MWLPSLRSYETTEKVNKLTNTVYTDTLCNILLGLLSEKNISPHFGSVYGVYSGITTEYWEDISDDYMNVQGRKMVSKNSKSFTK